MAAIFCETIFTRLFRRQTVKSSWVCDIKSLSLVYLVIGNKLNIILIIQIIQLAPSMAHHAGLFSLFAFMSKSVRNNTSVRYVEIFFINT